MEGDFQLPWIVTPARRAREEKAEIERLDEVVGSQRNLYNLN